MLSSKKLLGLILMLLLVVSGICIIKMKALAEDSKIKEQVLNLQVVSGTTFLPLSSPPLPIIRQKLEVIVTAYSSSIWVTEGDPFITACGSYVRDGIVANNLLPFGTKIRLSKLYGDKIFVVEDRMNARKSDYHIDIWFPSREQALEFGAKVAEMEILD